MIFYSYDRKGCEHLSDFQDLLEGQSVFLVGGAPSLKEQPYSLLESRGVTTFALNNTGSLFQPDFMVAADVAPCFGERLLKDPKIVKFFNRSYKDTPIREGSDIFMKNLPNSFFLQMNRRNKDYALFDRKMDTYWKRNSLFVAFVVLQELGVKRIFLAGSDFGSQIPGEDYSAGSTLNSEERKWNELLYRSQIRDLIKLKPVFQSNGIELIDTSLHSKLKNVYETMDFEKAIQSCLSDFPKEEDLKSLPHVSRLVERETVEKVISSGKTAIVEPPDIDRSFRPSKT